MYSVFTGVHYIYTFTVYIFLIINQNKKTTTIAQTHRDKNNTRYRVSYE